MTVRLLAVFLALVAAGCASSGAIPKPFPGATGAPGASATANMERRFQPAALVETALGFRGVPYRNGGSDPSGFDCSGFVQYVFAQHGLALPREVQQQFTFGDTIEAQEARTGDLIFFSTVGEGATHVGLIVEGDQFVHAPSTRGAVRVERYNAPYWSQRLVGVRRLQ